MIPVRLRRPSFRTRLLGVFLVLSVLPLGAAGVLAYRQGEARLRAQLFEQLGTVALLRGEQIEAWLEARAADVTRPAAIPAFRDLVAALVRREREPEGRAAARQLREILHRIGFSGGLAEMFLLEPLRGRVLLSTDPEQEGKFKSDRPYFREGRKGPYLQHVYYSLTLQRPVMAFSAPIEDSQGRLGGILVGRADLTFLDRLMAERSGLGRTGRAFLVNRFNYFVSDSLGRGPHGWRAVWSEGARRALAGQTGTDLYVNHEGQPVVGAYRWLPGPGLALIAEMRQEEAFAPIREFAIALALIGGLVASAAVALSVLLSREATRPLTRLVEAARAIGRGDLAHQVTVRGPSELALLASAMNGMARDLLASRQGLEEYSQDLEERVAARTLESEGRRHMAEALAQVERTISESLDPAEVGQRIADSVRGLLGSEFAALYRLDEESGDLLLLSFSGGSAGPTPPARFPARAGLIGISALEQRPVSSADVLNDPAIALPHDARAYLEQAGVRAALAVPLVAKGLVIGALGIGHRDGRAFGDEEIRLAQAFAHRAAVALENAGLYGQAEAHARKLTSLARLTRLIAAASDPRSVFQEIAAAALTLLRAKLARVWRPDPATGSLRIELSVGLEPGLEEAATEVHTIGRGTGVIGEIVESRAPEYVADIQQDPRWLDQRLAREAGLHAHAGVPMMSGDRLVGVLSILFGERRRFTPEEKELMSLLADHAAIAIENAHLVDRLRSHQVRLESLLEVSRQISRLQPPDALLTTIAETCGRLLGSRSVGFRLLEGDELRVVATWGDAREAMPTASIRVGESLSGLVALTREPLIVDDVTDDPRLIPAHREALRRLGHRAFLGVPVEVGGRLVGVLSVRSPRAHAFSTEDLGIATAFASQAATALESARLYEETRKAYEELSRTQDQLLQAQKMEAVGRLAGGIAHDFNNLLTIITGRSEILLGRLPPDSPARHNIELIQKTAQRAAGMTKQLLAFSRKQLLQPKALNLNAVVGGLETMLRRLIGEDIELAVRLDPGLGQAMADPAQLEQVLLNLVVNARDAMPRGGRLTIETANVVRDQPTANGTATIPAGTYVTVAVRDTGCGMDPATRARIFEPFFTTKAKGEGTGLGLSTVYGIIRQSGGHVSVASEVGRGSTFTIYLPRVEQPAEPAVPAAGPPAPDRGWETILLVEDEREVRDLACEILQGCGYRVLAASHGVEALERAERHPGPIHLLLTDVVMPKMSGRELAERLVSTYRDLKVLYLSGYTDDRIARHGVLDPGTLILEKPFSPEALARKVREALDAPAPCLV